MAENGKRKTEKKSFRKANLKGKSLRGEDLRGLDFRKAKLKGADLSGADLSEADLSGADLSQAVLVDVKAVKTKWTGANFDKTTIKNFVTEDTDFTKTNFRQIQAEGWNDTNSRFGQASLSKCRISQSRFHKTQFSQSEFFRGRFDECHFTQCAMKSLKSPAVRFEKCELEGCAAESADLLSVLFAESKISKCSFASADMAGMLSSDTNWKDCDFNRAELTTAEFKSSALDSCKFEKANFRYVSGLDQNTLNEIKAGGGKVSRYLLKKFFKWAFGTNAGRISMVAAVVTATIFGLSYTKNPSKWSEEKLWDRLQLAEQQDRLDDAIMYYQSYIDKLDPKSDRLVAAKIGLARVKVRVGADSDAVAILDEVLHDDLILPHERAEALTQRTSINIRLGHFDSVNEVVEELIETTENSDSLLNAYRSIVGQLVPQREYDRVIQLIELALKKYPDNEELKSEMILLRAQSLINSDKIDVSIADFKTLLEMSPSDGHMRDALSGLGQAYRSKGELERSRQYYAKVAEMFPDQIENVFMARMDEAQALRAMNRHTEAIEQMTRIVKEAPEGDIKTRARITLANLMMDRRRFDEAMTLLNESLKDAPKGDALWIEAMISKAQISKHKGNADEAIGILNGIMEEDIDRSFDQWARSLRVEYLAQEDRIEEAIVDAKELLEVSTDNVIRTSNVLLLARLYIRNQDWKAALKVLNEIEAGQIDPNLEMEIFMMKLSIFEKANMSEKAIALIDSMGKEKSNPRMNLAAKIFKIEMYWSQGDRDQTAIVLDEILAMKKLPHEMPHNLMRLPGMQLDEELKEKVLQIFLMLEKSPAQNQLNFGKWQCTMTLGHIYRDMGNFEEAKKRYQSIFQEAKDQYTRLQSAESLGQLYVQNDMQDEGKKVYNEIIKTWPNLSEAQTGGYIGLADIARHNMEYEKASSLLKKAQELCDDDMNCCQVISANAQNLRESGQDKELMAVYKMVLDKYPNCWVANEAKEQLEIENNK